MWHLTVRWPEVQKTSTTLMVGPVNEVTAKLLFPRWMCSTFVVVVVSSSFFLHMKWRFKCSCAGDKRQQCSGKLFFPHTYYSLIQIYMGLDNENKWSKRRAILGNPLFFLPFTVALLRWRFPGLEEGTPLSIGTLGATLGHIVWSDRYSSWQFYLLAKNYVSGCHRPYAYYKNYIWQHHETWPLPGEASYDFHIQFSFFF